MQAFVNSVSEDDVENAGANQRPSQSPFENPSGPNPNQRPVQLSFENQTFEDASEFDGPEGASGSTATASTQRIGFKKYFRLKKTSVQAPVALDANILADSE